MKNWSIVKNDAFGNLLSEQDRNKAEEKIRKLLLNDHKVEAYQITEYLGSYNLYLLVGSNPSSNGHLVIFEATDSSSINWIDPYDSFTKNRTELRHTKSRFFKLKELFDNYNKKSFW